MSAESKSGLRARGWYVDVANYDKLAKQEPLSNGQVVSAVTWGPMLTERQARAWAGERGYQMERVFFDAGAGEAKLSFGKVRATVGVLKRLGWKERQTYGDGVVRMSRGAWDLFVSTDGTCSRPMTYAQKLEYARLREAGIVFRGGKS